MTLEQQGDIYILRCTFEERHIALKLGFSWHIVEKYFYTRDMDSVRLYYSGLHRIKEEIERDKIREEEGEKEKEIREEKIREDRKKRKERERIEREERLEWERKRNEEIESKRKLIYSEPFFIWQGDGDYAKDSGLKREGGGYRTTDWRVALGIMKYADDSARNQILKLQLEYQGRISASMGVECKEEFPKPEGVEYLGFQRAGVKFINERGKVLLADEMGTGKTIIAIGHINSSSYKRILIVCPNSLKMNWEKELRKWLFEKYIIQKISSTGKLEVGFNIFGGGDYTGGYEGYKGVIYIINYDILHKYNSFRNLDLMILDESHYVKNMDTRRFRAVKDVESQKKLLLTGTPLLNRPGELFSQLKILGHDLSKDWKEFERKYCIHRENLGNLQDILRSTCMIRRLKKDVLLELPDKRRQGIGLEVSGRDLAELMEIQNKFYTEGLRELVKSNFDEFIGRVFREYRAYIFRIKHLLGVIKIPYVLKYVVDLLESVEKVVIFTHHKDVLEGLKEGLQRYGVVTLSGSDSEVERNRVVDEFQTGDSRIFIGSIKSSGVGITLTAASTVVFAEIDWTPAVLSQAEDRCHRVGQKDSVNVYHLTIKDTLEDDISDILIRKQEIIDKTLNKGI